MTESERALADEIKRLNTEIIPALYAKIDNEKERCAKIADKFAEANARFNGGAEAVASAVAALAIAAQIRS